jgi:ribose 5-phosphate isomerase B
VTAAVAIGADEAGLALKDRLAAMLRDAGVEVTDYGADPGDGTDYPDVALTVAEAVARGEHARAILICGTGIGMAIAANKVPGVYAAQVHDAYSAERARKSNNAQVMTLGARVVGPELAEALVRIWLDSEFQGGASARKVAKIAAAEARLLPGAG